MEKSNLIELPEDLKGKSLDLRVLERFRSIQNLRRVEQVEDKLVISGSVGEVEAANKVFIIMFRQLRAALYDVCAKFFPYPDRFHLKLV